MKLSVAMGLILVELGAGVLLLLPMVPIKEVRKSFFSFHSLMASLCFGLAAAVFQSVLDDITLVGLAILPMLLSLMSFGMMRMGKAGTTRILHCAAGGFALFCLVFAVNSSLASYGHRLGPDEPGRDLTFVLASCLVGSSFLGTALLGATHNSMALGHWYLISRNLSFAYLIRSTKVLLGLLGCRTVFMILILLMVPVLQPTLSQRLFGQLYSVHGDLMFFVMRVLWGLALPSVLAFMAWRCALTKSNQAATGLLYLCEFSVLFGELLAAYLMV